MLINGHDHDDKTQSTTQDQRERERSVLTECKVRDQGENRAEHYKPMPAVDNTDSGIGMFSWGAT